MTAEQIIREIVRLKVAESIYYIEGHGQTRH